jgi:hypothetical protein
LFACIADSPEAGIGGRIGLQRARNTRYRNTKNRRQPAHTESKMAGRHDAGPPIKISLALGNDRRRGGLTFAFAFALANAPGKARRREAGDQDNR